MVYLLIIHKIVTISIGREEWMVKNLGKWHSFPLIYHENSLKEINCLLGAVIKFIFSADYCSNIKKWCTFPGYLHFHIVPLEWILSKDHKIEENCNCPHIHQYSIRLIANNLGCHIFLSPALGLGTNFADRPCETKISYFVQHLVF